MDDDVVCEASRQEIVRRYYAALCDQRKGSGSDETVFKLELLMKQASVTPAIRPVVARASQAEEESGEPAVCIHLPNGELVIGGMSELMGPAAAALLNAVKSLAHIEHPRHLVARAAIEPIQSLKTKYLGGRNPRLHSDEILIALAISAATDEYAAKAMKKLTRLRDCEVHSTVILGEQDAATYARLGMRVTCTPKYQSKNLFHR